MKAIDPRPVRRVVPEHEKRCVWMTAGILSYRICSRNYDCTECLLDQAIRQQCGDAPRSGLEPIPPHEFLHRGHAWACVGSDGTIEIGIDDFARRLLGLVTWVDLPRIGTEVRQGRPAWKLSHGACEADVLSPVTGWVAAVNDSLREDPGRVARSPHDAGWVARIETKDFVRDVPNLLFGRPLEAFLCDETRRLERAIAGALGDDDQTEDAPRLNDGGKMPTDFLQGLPRGARERVLRTFLRREGEDHEGDPS